MSQVHASILLKRPRRSASARSCACFMHCQVLFLINLYASIYIILDLSVFTRLPVRLTVCQSIVKLKKLDKGLSLFWFNLSLFCRNLTFFQLIWPFALSVNNACIQLRALATNICI